MLANLAKYRIKSNIDRFGYGLKPSVVDAANIVVFTNLNGLLTATSLNKATPLSDMTMAAYRWDHRIHCIVIVVNADGIDIDKPFPVGSLGSLCKETGGDVVYCRDVKDAHSAIRVVVSKIVLAPVSVAVRVSYDSQDVAGGTSSSSDLACVEDSVLVRLPVTAPSEWLIPEQDPVDLRGDLCSRPPQPVLSISRRLQCLRQDQAHCGWDCTAPLTAVEAAHFFSTAEELSVSLDCYDITSSSVFAAPEGGGGSGSGKAARTAVLPHYLRHKGLRGDEWHFVTVKEITPSKFRGDGRLARYFPFALLGPKRGVVPPSKATLQLTIFPYNFPFLFAAANKVLQLMRNDPLAAAALSTPGQCQKFAWFPTWTADFSAYLGTVPLYSHQLTLQAMHKSLFKQLTAGVTGADFQLHKNPYRLLTKAQSSATADLKILEQLTSQRASDCKGATDVTVIALAQVAPRQLPVSVAALADSQELLVCLEQMRRTVYGGGEGLLVRGLGTHKAGALATAASSSSGLPEDWFEAAVGQKYGLNKSTSRMSDYLPVLARREALRDAADCSDDVLDEDTPAGVLRRKFQVNFGSRYAKQAGAGKKTEKTDKGGNAVFLEVEGVSGLRATGGDERSSNPAQAELMAMDEYFQDTPNPYSHPDREAEQSEWKQGCSGGGPAAEATRVTSVMITDERAQEHGKQGRARCVGLPPLGAPRKRSKPAQDAPTQSLQSPSSLEPPAAGCGGALSAMAPATPSPSSSPLSFTLSPSSPASPVSVCDTCDASESVSVSVSTSLPVSSSSNSVSVSVSDEWSKCYSSRQQRHYWFSAATGQSVWECPNNCSCP